MLKRIFAAMMFAVALTFLTANVSAQTITDEDVEESERRKKVAQNNKDIAEAQKAELDARVPKPDRGSLVGGTTVEGDFIEAKMLGYCAMKAAARQIGGAINNKTLVSARFVVYSEQDVKMLSRYQLMIERLTILKKGYEDLTRIQRLAGGPTKSFGPGLIANKFLDYLSLMKTDIDFTGTEFDIDEREIVAEVYSELVGRELFYPQRIPLSFRTGHGVANSRLFRELAALGAAHDDARNVSAADVPARDRLDPLYYSTMKELGLGDKPAPPPTCPAAACPAAGACPAASCSQNTNVNVNVDTKAEEQAGGAASDKTFFSYLQAENLHKTMTNGTTYWLDIAVTKAGGNMRVKSNIITNFMIGSRVNFSGGAIVYFHVFDLEGRSKLSGVVPAYENYRKSSRIGSTCN